MKNRFYNVKFLIIIIIDIIFFYFQCVLLLLFHALSPKEHGNVEIIKTLTVCFRIGR